jgi:type II secretion system protein N
MLKKVCRWLCSCIGYLLYTAGLLVFLLWLLFPKEVTRRYLEEFLNHSYPELRWQVGAVALEIPTGLTLRAIEGYEKGGENPPLVRIAGVTLRPNFVDSLRAWRPQVEYRLEAGKGKVVGFGRLQGGQGGIHVEGLAQDVKLTDFPLLSRQLGRAVQGLVSGTFTCTVLPAKGDVAELEAHLKIENGRLGLKRPILNHTELPFSLGTVILHGQGETLHLEHGILESELFDGQFSGKITISQEPALSQLDVKGAMQPKTKFFKGLNNTVALQAFRVQLKENALPFRISGELSNPGIHYEEFSMLFQTLEKELK